MFYFVTIFINRNHFLRSYVLENYCKMSMQNNFKTKITSSLQ
ncbi:hypothetical Protein psc1_01060 [Candidatus Phytoplasma solani]